MSVFKPDNLNPNFTEVVVKQMNNVQIPTSRNNLLYHFDNEVGNDGGNLVFSFDVHTNMSYVRAYCITIMTKIATEENPDDSILGEFYGNFENPYQDGDRGIVKISYSELLN